MSQTHITTGTDDNDHVRYPYAQQPVGSLKFGHSVSIELPVYRSLVCQGEGCLKWSTNQSSKIMVSGQQLQEGYYGDIWLCDGQVGQKGQPFTAELHTKGDLSDITLFSWNPANVWEPGPSPPLKTATASTIVGRPGWLSVKSESYVSAHCAESTTVRINGNAGHLVWSGGSCFEHYVSEHAFDSHSPYVIIEVSVLDSDGITLRFEPEPEPKKPKPRPIAVEMPLYEGPEATTELSLQTQWLALFLLVELIICVWITWVSG